MDNRRKKTKEKIKNTFIALMRGKDPARITAKELCLEADINRSTFYDHYPCMDDLIREIIHDQAVWICTTATAGGSGELSPGLPQELIEGYIRQYQENMVLQRLLTAEHSRSYYRLLIEEQMGITLAGKSVSGELYYRAMFQNTGAVSLVAQWLQDGQKMPIAQLTHIIQDFSVALYPPRNEQEGNPQED